MTGVAETDPRRDRHGPYLGRGMGHRRRGDHGGDRGSPRENPWLRVAVVVAPLTILRAAGTDQADASLTGGGD